jgi:serine/threonine protein kinase
MSDDLPFRAGTTVNQYAIQRYLEPGALGPAYQAFDTTVSRLVELRVVNNALLDPTTSDRVRRIAERLVRLRHPHILSVLNFGNLEENFYLITENVRGMSLAQRIENDPPQQDAALPIVRTVGEVIDFIHDEGLVHGKLVPEGILLGSDDQVWVADAGILPHLSTDPEQYTVERDRRHLAALAYHLLTGFEPAFNRPAQPASQLNPGLGPATDAVLARGLATGPGSGWPGCDQFVKALTEAVERDRDQARVRAPAIQRTAQRPARSGWSRLAALVVVLALAGIGFLIWQLTHQPASPVVTLSSASVQPGSSLIVSASHLPASQAGTIEVQSSPRQIGVFQADRYGNLTQGVTIPANTDPGDHLVSLCWNGSCPASTTLHVLTPPPPSPTPHPTPTPTTPPPTATPTPTPTPTPRPTPTSTIPTPTTHVSISPR